MRRPFFLAATGAAVVVGLVLRLVALTEGTLSLDEAYTVILAQNSVARIFQLAPTDTHPPIINLAYKLWITLCGRSELAWELLSVLWGVVAIALTARLAAGAFDRPSGAVSAWLLALSPLHVKYSQQMRSFSLAVVLAVVATSGLVRYLAEPRMRYAVWFLGAAWLLVNTNYYGFLIVGALFAAAFGAQLRRVGGDRSGRVDAAGVRRLAVLAGILLVASVPTLIAVYLQYTRYYSFDWIQKPSAGDLKAVAMALGGRSLPLVALLIALVVAGAVRAARTGRRSQALVLLSWLLLPLLLAYAASAAGRPFLHPRYSVLWLVPLLVMAAYGMTWPPRPWLRGVLVAAGLLLGLPALVDYYGERASTAGEKAAYRYVAANYREGDVVLHLSKVSWAPALFYHDQALEEYFLHGTPSSNVMRYWRREKSELEVAEIGAYQRVWIYRWPQLPPIFDRVLREILNRESFQQLGPRLLYADQDGTLFLFALAGAEGPGGRSSETAGPPRP